MSTITEFKCPCCGGAIEFNTQSQNMKCPYCDTEFDIDTLKSYNEARTDATDKMEWDTSSADEWVDENMNVFVCESCGGEILTDATTTATACPYCDNPIVLSGRVSGVLRPDAVIPFKLDKNAAKSALKQHFKGKKLLPNAFKSDSKIDEIKGVYVPVWLFDCDTDANINYRATRVRNWSDSNYNYTETSHFLATRAGEIGFERVPVDGSQKMADDLMESIEPYDFNDAVDFNTAYLSGFLADKYDVTADESINRANERIKSSTIEAFTQTVTGYTTVTADNANVCFKNGAVKYALYPVWLLNVKWQDKLYPFAMNGQTGKFVGNLPMDKSKLVKWLLGTFAASAGILGLLASQFLL